MSFIAFVLESKRRRTCGFAFRGAGAELVSAASQLHRSQLPASPTGVYAASPPPVVLNGPPQASLRCLFIFDESQ